MSAKDEISVKISWCSKKGAEKSQNHLLFAIKRYGKYVHTLHKLKEKAYIGLYWLKCLCFLFMIVLRDQVSLIDGGKTALRNKTITAPSFVQYQCQRYNLAGKDPSLLLPRDFLKMNRKALEPRQFKNEKAHFEIAACFHALCRWGKKAVILKCSSNLSNLFTLNKHAKTA